ncbi:hypothetical protein BC940DRAFT_291128 [Gongronella butleri]|nr:hypothetical protein BC940DRAFT_291128 [Gongronella butleri]
MSSQQQAVAASPAGESEARAAAPAVDRQVKVFRPPSNAQQQVQVPDTFYKLDSNQVAQLYKAQVQYRQKLEDAPLKTQKMRQAEELERMKKYPKTTIRVRLPDLTVLQATFESKEKVGDLYEFLGSTLATPDRAFLLCLPPRTKLVDPHVTLYKAGLAPASNLMLVWLNPAAGPKTAAVLSQTYMDKIEPMDVPVATPPPGTSSGASSSKANSSSGSGSTGSKPVPSWLKNGLFKKKQ